MRELIRGGMGPKAGRAGVSPWSDLPLGGRAEVPPWSDLPLNRVLYIPFSIFANSRNTFIASFVRVGSTLAEGTLKYCIHVFEFLRGVAKKRLMMVFFKNHEAIAQKRGYVRSPVRNSSSQVPMTCTARVACA